MRFKSFEKVIPEINKLSLPGHEMQLKMAPPFRKKLIDKFKESRKSAKLAVEHHSWSHRMTNYPRER